MTFLDAKFLYDGHKAFDEVYNTIPDKTYKCFLPKLKDYVLKSGLPECEIIVELDYESQISITGRNFMTEHADKIKALYRECE
jgi:hypothetical protein